MSAVKSNAQDGAPSIISPDSFNVFRHPPSKLKAEFPHRRKDMFQLFRNRVSRRIAPAGVVAAIFCALLPMNARTRPRAPYDPGTSVSEPRVFAPGTIS